MSFSVGSKTYSIRLPHEHNESASQTARTNSYGMATYGRQTRDYGQGNGYAPPEDYMTRTMPQKTGYRLLPTAILPEAPSRQTYLPHMHPEDIPAPAVKKADYLATIAASASAIPGATSTASIPSQKEMPTNMQTLYPFKKLFAQPHSQSEPQPEEQPQANNTVKTESATRDEIGALEHLIVQEQQQQQGAHHNGKQSEHARAIAAHY